MYQMMSHGGIELKKFVQPSLVVVVGPTSSSAPYKIYENFLFIKSFTVGWDLKKIKYRNDLLTEISSLCVVWVFNIIIF